MGILTECLEIYSKLEKDNAMDTLRKMSNVQKNLTAQMSIVDQASGDAGSQINRKKMIVNETSKVGAASSQQQNQHQHQQTIGTSPNQTRPLAATEHHHEILERG